MITFIWLCTKKRGYVVTITKKSSFPNSDVGEDKKQKI
jgi:hypothetical protein